MILGGAAAAAAGSGSGSTSGFVSIAIGIVIIVLTVRWTIVSRRANKASVNATPAPPVRRLGADADWWRENGGTASPGPDGEPGPSLPHGDG